MKTIKLMQGLQQRGSGNLEVEGGMHRARVQLSYDEDGSPIEASHETEWGNTENQAIAAVRRWLAESGRAYTLIY